MFKGRTAPCIHGVLAGRCRECKKEWKRQWRAAHPGSGTKAKDEWRKANPARHREQFTKRNQGGYLRKYGITFAAASALRMAQGNRCLGCLLEMTEAHGAHRWNVDHFVDTQGNKIVRGILCTNCNKALGLAGDHDPEALRRLADYLEARGYVRRTTVRGESSPSAEESPQLKLTIIGAKP